MPGLVLSLLNLWEQTSAAGTGLVTSDLRAPQLRLPFLTASEAQAGISFEVKLEASEAFKLKNLIGFTLCVSHSWASSRVSPHHGTSFVVSRGLIKISDFIYDVCLCTQFSSSIDKVTVTS